MMDCLNSPDLSLFKTSQVVDVYDIVIQLQKLLLCYDLSSLFSCMIFILISWDKPHVLLVAINPILKKYKYLYNFWEN